MFIFIMETTILPHNSQDTRPVKSEIHISVEQLRSKFKAMVEMSKSIAEYGKKNPYKSKK